MSDRLSFSVQLSLCKSYARKLDVLYYKDMSQKLQKRLAVGSITSITFIFDILFQGITLVAISTHYISSQGLTIQFLSNQHVKCYISRILTGFG